MLICITKLMDWISKKFKDLQSFLYFNFFNDIKNNYIPNKCKHCLYSWNILGHTNTFKNSLGDNNSPLKIAHTLYNKFYSQWTERGTNFLTSLPIRIWQKRISLNGQIYFQRSEKNSRRVKSQAKNYQNSLAWLKLKSENIHCILNKFHFRFFFVYALQFLIYGKVYFSYFNWLF